MRLVVDIGNSNAVVGVFAQNELHHNWRFATPGDPGGHEFKIRLVEQLHENDLLSGQVQVLLVSSVVPNLSGTVADFLSDLFQLPCPVLGPDIYNQLDLTVSRPDQIGSDLVANAFGAISIYQSDVLVVDFGTALTVLGVGLDRQIHGASIAPGLGTAIRTLSDVTAKLPVVPMELPPSVLGNSTERAIQSGTLLGYVGLVKELLARYRLEWSAGAMSVATGGLSGVLLPELGAVIDYHRPHLTLQGLNAIANELA